MSSEISRGKENCLSSQKSTKFMQIRKESKIEVEANDCFEKNSKITANYTNY